MPEPIYIILMTAVILIDVITAAMFIRCIISWFLGEMDNKFTRLLLAITEPALMPLRKLFVKMNWFQQTPLDMSFIFTWMLLSLLEMSLRYIMG